MLGGASRCLSCKNYKSHIYLSKRHSSKHVWAAYSSGCLGKWLNVCLFLQCFPSCGRGHKSRKVYCSAPNGSQISEAKCQSKKPKQKKPCRNKRPCGGYWFAGPWSEVGEITHFCLFNSCIHVYKYSASKDALIAYLIFLLLLWIKILMYLVKKVCI